MHCFCMWFQVNPCKKILLIESLKSEALHDDVRRLDVKKSTSTCCYNFPELNPLKDNTANSDRQKKSLTHSYFHQKALRISF